MAAEELSRASRPMGFYRRHLRATYWIKALLQSGTLGQIGHVEVREGLVPASDISSDLVFRPNLASGVLRDPGIHILDLLIWWFGDLELVDYRDDNEGGAEAECILECRLPSGASGRVELSHMRPLRNSIRIQGSAGFVEVHLYKNQVLAGSPNALAFRHNGFTASAMKPQFISELRHAELNNSGTYISGTKAAELIERCYIARRPLILPWVKAMAGPALDDVALPGFPRGSKVMVTGATGFVGGRLVERLIHEHGVQVRCLIRNTEHAARLGRFPVEVACVDLGNTSEIDRAVKGTDYVFHCAYDTEARQKNVAAIHNLIDACAIHSIRRLVHVSTFAVYQPYPDGPLTEKTRDGNRSNPYVDSKLGLEELIFEAVRTRGVPATVIQPAIVYGPFGPQWTNAPAEMLMFGDVILPDSGDGLCNAVYIDDLVDSLILAAVSPAAVGERFIVAGPQPVTWATFFSGIARALQTEPPKFWPYERMVKTNNGALRLISNPKRLIKMIVRLGPIRQIIKSCLNAMPGRVRSLIMKSYADSRGPRHRETFLPSRETLAVYRSKAITYSEKARTKLGYKPRFDFERGMALTGTYLEWMYKDVHPSSTTQHHEPC